MNGIDFLETIVYNHMVWSQGRVQYTDIVKALQLYRNDYLMACDNNDATDQTRVTSLLRDMTHD